MFNISFSKYHNQPGGFNVLFLILSFHKSTIHVDDYGNGIEGIKKNWVHTGIIMEFGE